MYRWRGHGRTAGRTAQSGLQPRRPAARRSEGMDQTTIQPRCPRSAFTGSEFSPYRFFTADKWAEFRADTPLTLTEDEVRAAALAQRPGRSRRGAADLPVIVAAAFGACGIVSQLLFEQRKHFLNLSNGDQDAVHHRDRRLGGRRQVDHRAYPEGASGPLAVEPEGRSGDHRRFSLSQRGAQARKPDGPQGLSRKLRCRCGLAVSLRDQGRQHNRCGAAAIRT
jgi:hypothetical protein